MISKNIKSNRELFRNFLRERDLTTVFRRFQALKRRKRKAINIFVGGEERPVVAFKTKKRIIFRDPQNLAVVSSTSRFRKLKDVPVFFQVFERNRKEFLNIELKQGGVFKPQFRRTDVKREIFKNTIHFETVRPLARKVGKIFISVTFFKEGKKQTVEGGSRKNRLLTDPKDRQDSFDEAFIGSLDGLDFYNWEKFEVNWIRFFYKTPKTEQRLVFA